MKKFLLTIVIIIMLISIFSGCESKLSIQEEHAKEIAISYLNAWEDMNYNAMCSYLGTWCGPGWIENMESFPVPVRNCRIERVRTEDSIIIIDYSIEAPNLGCIVGAFIDDNPKDKARLLLIDGKFITWKDTLRLVEVDNSFQIQSSIDNIKTEEASNRFINFINSLGIDVMILHPIEDIEGRLTSALAFYMVEFDISQQEMSKKLPEIINQLEEYKN